MVEFATTGYSDLQIEVRDVETGHQYEFTVVEAPDGARVLSETVQARENQLADVSVDEVPLRARSFAEAEALNAGIIDRFHP